MQTTGDALLQAIIEDPNADDLRLIYADWLDDHGEPARAEFIRVQVRLAAMDKDDPARIDLEDRAAVLLDTWRGTWLAPYESDLAIQGRRSPEFRRGFLVDVLLTGQAFLDRGEHLLRENPVEVVRVQGLGPEDDLDANVAALASSRALQRVPHVVLSNNRLTTRHLRMLLAGGQLEGRRGLNLGQNPLDAEAAEVLATWPGAASLRVLALGAASITSRGLIALASSPHLAGLRELRLGSTGIDGEGVRALVESVHLTRLLKLELDFNNLNETDVRLLAHCPHLACLTQLGLNQSDPASNWILAEILASPYLTNLMDLDLAASGITAADVRLLAEAERFQCWRWLDLAENDLGPEGARLLAFAPQMARLRELELSQTNLGDEGARHLAASPYLRPAYLDLADNTIGPVGGLALAASPILERVDDVDFGDIELNEAGLIALARNPAIGQPCGLDLATRPVHGAALAALLAAPWTGRLTRLQLNNTGMTDADGLLLARSPILARVRHLDLSENALSDATAAALAECPTRSLRYLCLNGNQMTDAGAHLLAESPNLRGLECLLVWHNRLTETGLEKLWQTFGDRLRPSRKQWEQRGT